MSSRSTSINAPTNPDARVAADARLIAYPESAYSRIWEPLWQRLDDLHQTVAPAAYLGAKQIAIANHPGSIPQLKYVSHQLRGLTGFSLVEADGKVDGPTFFDRLADRTFSATTFLRGEHELYFTSQPDWVHEFVGHVVPLHDTRVADLYEHFGRVARGLSSPTSLQQLERLYWFSAETGVVREGGITKAFGAALLSSVSELQGLSQYERVPFDPHHMVNTEFHDNAPQRFVFEAKSLDELLFGVHDYLGFLAHTNNA